MHIPIKWYQAHAQGSVFKVVVCENCQVEFVYLLARRAMGDGTSVLYLDNEGASRRAAASADAQLQRMLQREQDPVPCPACGWYQQFMIPLLRKNYCQWMTVAGAGFLYLAAVLLVVLALWAMPPRGRWAAASDQVIAQGIAWAASLGCGLLLIRKLLSSRLQPNEGDAEARRELGQQLAMTRAEYERTFSAEQDGPS